MSVGHPAVADLASEEAALASALTNALLAWARGNAPLHATTAPMTLSHTANSSIMMASRLLMGDGCQVVTTAGDAVGGSLSSIRASEAQGALSEPGDELAVGDDFYVQVERYTAAAFLPIAGPTLLRVTDDEDLDAFLADVDAALAGTWPEALQHPMVHIADQCGLGAATCGGLARRAHVDQADNVRTTPGGPVLGRLDELASGHVPAVGHGCDHTCRPPALAERMAVEIARRPSLGRLLTSLDVVRALASSRGHRGVVSGFGDRLMAADHLPAQPIDLQRDGERLPYVVTAEGNTVVFDARTHALVAVGRDAAVLVDALLAAGAEQAPALAAASLGVPVETAASALLQVCERLSRARVSVGGAA